MKDQFIDESGAISEEAFNGVEVMEGNSLRCSFIGAVIGASLGFFSNYFPLRVLAEKDEGVA